MDIFTGHPQERRIRELEAERKNLFITFESRQKETRQVVDRIWRINREITRLYDGDGEND